MNKSYFLTQVENAKSALRDVMAETPLQRNDFLSEKYQAEVFLKREDLTPVRSYKLRGAFNAMRKVLDERGKVEFVCASAGNHAQGVAYAARHFDVKATIFMPVATPGQKIKKTQVFGGDNIRIEMMGDYFDETLRASKAYSAEVNGHFLAPFDDEDVIVGQATIASEIMQICPDFDHIFMPVGGGGLSSGLTRYFEIEGPNPVFHFVEPLGASSLYESLIAGKAQPLERVDSFVDGAAVAQIGQKNFEYLKGFSPEQVIRVPENRLCVTMEEMLNIEGVVLEPAGALSIDALRDVDIRGKKVVCVVSGGNFDFERLPDVKERAMRFGGTKKYFILRLPQRPGALRDFLNLLGPNDDIARFEYMKKSARQFGTVLIGIETGQPENFGQLFERLDGAGFQYSNITDDEKLGAFLI